MLRRLAVVVSAKRALSAVSAASTSAVTSRAHSYATKKEEPMDDAEFEFFEDDLWFLDELADENLADIYSFIPSSDATLLGHDKPPTK